MSSLIYQILSSKKIDKSKYFYDFIYINQLTSNFSYYSLGGMFPNHVITSVSISNDGPNTIYLTTDFMLNSPIPPNKTVNLVDVWLSKVILSNVQSAYIVITGITLEQLGVIV